MTNIINKHNKLLIKRSYLILFFLITYFLFTFNVNAANFNYADFDFEKFSEENLGYWTDQCAEGGESNQECKEKIISKQKKYYTRLYKILAAYQKSGITIDDNIIITTTFYGLTPDLLNDDGKNYDDLFGLDNSAYNYLEDDFEYYIDIIPNQDFFKKETDTLDLLIRNMFSYGSSCYAVYGDVTQVQTSTKDFTDTCLEGGTPLSVDGETKCAVKDSSNILTFIEYAALKLKLPSILSIFGIKSDETIECENKINDYPGAKMKSVPSQGKEYNPDAYWKFLETTNYFDKKAHLRSYFIPVLKKVDKLSNEEYEEELINVRKDITRYIKSILEAYGSKNTKVNLSNLNNSLYWWPIGGNEITESNGASFALGEPATFSVTSNFGKRGNSFHHGLDIGGVESGTINIVAARNGIVEKVVSDCTMADGLSCGGKYGNYVVLSHGDGNYTYYAHLHEGTIKVSQGQSVEQGQVLGKMGSTGNSTGPHLHFEIRIGGDNPSSAVNPLDYISAENPRQSSVSSSDLMSMLICMEGIGPDDGGSNYKVYDDSKKGTGTLTVGAGVTLINHKQRFIKRGFDIDNYMYEGALIPKDVVDDIKSEIITNIYDNINSEMNNNGINLTPYQIDALVSRQYNVGNILNFFESFNQYGNTQTLYDVYMSKPTTASGFSGDVLKTRREREWNLFHSGTYFTC
ncbi:MAG: M23 family metallopeptidase [Bacilli bacterium]|nr:M23 family metallopeptidase [Bacilli bacterium]MDD4407230.1 M23 family metallopeptidase [Bacilli bacterium]